MTVPSGIITCLPDADFDDVASVVEVLIQEHLNTFAVPLRRLGELRSIFGARANFGVWGVDGVEALNQAIEAGAQYVFTDGADEDMAAAAREHAVTWFASALTPLEVHAVLELGATGALLWPAEIVGHAMAKHLGRLGLVSRVIPMGGVGAFAAGEWLVQGAPAACVDEILLGDSLGDGDLGLLRDRCESFRKAALRGVSEG
ncbi:bifunctional 4-hydroxy-2-oxoglutarate aldolase/2-dehydro-3-deoxy-phosphogluconate aldolase [uncultured Tessaracoccus sp.]|uniref:bifunctional 4-hydroxy-2-oxoglutarate aldolase/2-dehydro-3-deoxy-phosphogluconate aldolase n=1 Tax=uncultured Tessaracoccus sp. TaxID=905023 RepID=UPI002635C390|nr:bifunctional 4-hydroxy-2-oxoglutarate aldolase/2-dehydro-3-deoxy-phosphogluconate aldolase [uncultured Tessaracoccus sp.]